MSGSDTDRSERMVPDSDDEVVADSLPTRGASQYLRRLKESFETERDSDVTVITGQRRRGAHRLQLILHSDVFAGLLEGKRGLPYELRLPEDDPCAMSMVLRFMYTFQYEPEIAQYDDDTVMLVLHMRTVKLAEKYNMPELAQLAFERFTIDLNAGQRWREAEFADAVTEAYAARNLNALKEGRDKKFASFWIAAKDYGEFSYELLMVPPRTPAEVRQVSASHDVRPAKRGRPRKTPAAERR